MARKNTPYRSSFARLRPVFWWVAGFSAIINVLMLTGSIYMMQVYDRVLSSGSVPTLVGLFTIVVVLYGFLGIYDFLRARILARASVNLDQTLADQVYASWLQSGVPGATGKGATAQPLRDLEAVRSFVGTSPMAGLFDLPFVPLFLAVLFVIHPLLGVLTIAGSAIVIGLTLLNQAMTNGLVQKALDRDAAARDFADSSKHSAEAVLAMGMGLPLTARWRGLHDDALAAGQSTSDPSEALTAFSKAFRMLLQSTILTLGAFLVLRGEISAGSIIAASLLSGRALAPVDQTVGQLRAISKTWAAHRRLSSYFAALPEPVSPMDLPAPTGQITLNGICKLAPGGSGPDQKRLLTQVSFALEPGDGLGVIGNSASGKSTLAKLLVGVWDADMGDLRMDGATRDQWDTAVLGRHIGYMPQSFILLPGTIRDNIARFAENAEDADVIAAARMAGVHDMILTLPDGYQTSVGGMTGAVQLSGGQVQRVGLARAVFGKPALVVLDEPNANLDTAGDEALTAAITALRHAGTTVIVMAHRPSAIAAVNKVLVLSDGTQVQFGPKDDVLGKVLAGGTSARPAKNTTPAHHAAMQQGRSPVPDSRPTAKTCHIPSAPLPPAPAPRPTGG